MHLLSTPPAVPVQRKRRRRRRRSRRRRRRGLAKDLPLRGWAWRRSCRYGSAGQ
jgi:hypothetical protein